MTGGAPGGGETGRPGGENARPGGAGARPPGGEGARPPGGEGAKPPGGQTFSLKGSWTSETIKQGQAKDLEISVGKGKESKQDIHLSFEADKGLTVEPKTADLKGSDESGKVAVKVKAAADAPVGTHHIKVMSEPPSAEPLDVTVKVDKP
jgi:hypothetical protein